MGYIDGPNQYIYCINNPIGCIDPFGLTVYVYGWEGWGNGSNVPWGHVSIRIKNEQGDFYYSFWPKEGYSIYGKALFRADQARFREGYADDLDFFKQNPDYVVEIDGADEAAMIEYFKKIQANPPRFNTLAWWGGTNCVRVSNEALIRGGILYDRVAIPHQSALRSLLSRNLIVREIAEGFPQETQLATDHAAKIFANIGDEINDSLFFNYLSDNATNNTTVQLSEFKSDVTTFNTTEYGSSKRPTLSK